jgi:hypothetical protein
VPPKGVRLDVRVRRGTEPTLAVTTTRLIGDLVTVEPDEIFTVHGSSPDAELTILGAGVSVVESEMAEYFLRYAESALAGCDE